MSKGFRGANIGNGLIVSICGFPGTGKSEIAWWLNRKLYRMNVSAHTMSLDRFYKEPVESRSRVRKETGCIGSEEMDWSRIEEELETFKNLNRISVLIVEGLYAGYVKHTNLSVYVDGDLDETYKIRKLRHKEDPDSDWRREVLKKECASISAMKHRADEVYDLKGMLICPECQNEAP